MSETDVSCQLCGRQVSPTDAFPASLIRPSLAATIRKEKPDWTGEGYLCLEDLNRCRRQHVQDALEAERGDLSDLERQVLDSVREQDLLARNVDQELDEKSTLGQRIADRVAEFGGSWAFILSFLAVLIGWIGVNSLVIGLRWDPYPFILLNLVLSCVAALQAPVIMMSQNRQEAKDRARAENDYRVNLKAEMEIRNLHAKVDLLITHQWQRLLEIQQIQTDMMQQLLQTKSGSLDDKPGGGVPADSLATDH